MYKIKKYSIKKHNNEELEKLMEYEYEYHGYEVVGIDVHGKRDYSITDSYMWVVYKKITVGGKK